MTETTSRRFRSCHLLLVLCTAAPLASGAGDWPMWGHDETRNMASDEKGLPDSFATGDFIGASDDIDPATTENVKWVARLGGQTYGNPTVAGGRVYVGTNNDSLRDKRYKGDRSCVMCFDEETGEFLWQLAVPKLGTGMVSDWDYVGICSSPSVEGNRAYLVTNRCEVICLDAAGLSDGNDGEVQDEARYLAGPEGEPQELAESDADIIWVLDMIEECGVQPHNITSSAVLVAGDLVWAATSNGVDVEDARIPAPEAPGLIAIDKKSGKLVAAEASGISSRIFNGGWSSPAYLRQGETELCIFGGPDGFCYAFSPEAAKDEAGRSVLKEVWRADCNRQEQRVDEKGEAISHSRRNGPSEVLATPVVHEGKVYCLTGQEPDHCQGRGNLICFDASGQELWSYAEINRSMSTVAIGDGLLFACDYAGFVYCLDAVTGELYWRHDTMGYTWGSPLLADGKVYIGNEDGYLTILPARKEYVKKDVKELELSAPVYASLIAANGALFLASHTHLYAIAASKE